ncbi:SprB repeat-containing protein [Candidatus Saccharibacteria bacterium]|nr:SprB repeat-containing protein [Candidatus Saccharibacteria bacterium]
MGAYETEQFTAQVHKSNISCFGDQDGAAIAMASGGYSPYIYL